MAAKVAINGFGRIGRNFLRASLGQSDFDVVAINDLTDAKTLAHLLKFDSVHGRLDAEVSVGEGEMKVKGKGVKILAESNPEKLP